jgi:hypothetical protein
MQITSLHPKVLAETYIKIIDSMQRVNEDDIF